MKPLDGIQDKQIEVEAENPETKYAFHQGCSNIQKLFHDPLFIALQSGSLVFPYRLPFSAAFSWRIQSRGLESSGSRRGRNAV